MLETETETKPFPAWASIPVILVCLAGGGWLIHWYINTGDLSQESKLLDTTSTPVAVANFTGPVETPIEQDANGWVVRTREAVLRIDQPKGGAAKVKSFSYRSTDLFPGDVWRMMLNGRAVVRNPTWQKTLQVSGTQLTQLQSATGPVLMVVAPTDSQHLLDLWNAYDAATPTDKNGAHSKLLSALSDVARKSVDATRQDVAGRAAKIKAALTEAQWKQFNGG